MLSLFIQCQQVVSFLFIFFIITFHYFLEVVAKENNKIFETTTIIQIILAIITIKRIITIIIKKMRVVEVTRLVVLLGVVLELIAISPILCRHIFKLKDLNVVFMLLEQ